MPLVCSTQFAYQRNILWYCDQSGFVFFLIPFLDSLSPCHSFFHFHFQKRKIVVCACVLVALANANADYQDIEAQAIVNTADQGATNAEGVQFDGVKRQEKRGLHKHEDYHVHEEKTLTIYKKIPVPYPVEKHIPVPIEKVVHYPVKVGVPAPYPGELKLCFLLAGAIS